MTEIGDIVRGPDIEQALLDTLRDFLPVYLAERATRRNLPASTYQVASYARAATIDTRFPNEYLPCVAARCISKANQGVEGGSGEVPAAFTVLVGVLLKDQQRDKASDIVWDYLAAIEAVLGQHGALGGVAVATLPGDSQPEDVPVEERRTLAGGTLEVQVIVEAAYNAYLGPTEPPGDPYEPLPDDPQVQDVDISFTRAD